MPTITDIVDRVVAWTDEKICQKVKLKAPPEDYEAADGAGYEYELITPACFPLFVPSKEKLPPKINAPIPSICVRILEGEDGRDMGVINPEMCFSTWNPGTHGEDILKPSETQFEAFKPWTGEESKEFFLRNTDGWRDLWNWIDTALRELESTASIDGLPIDRESGIKYSPMKEEDGIPDFYPFSFGSIVFTLKRPLVRVVEDYDKYL